MYQSAIFLPSRPEGLVRSALRGLSLLLIAGLLISASTGAVAVAHLTLEWDAVDDDRVAVYELHYGTVNHVYQGSITTQETRAMLSGLEAETTYYLAVRACTTAGQVCGGFSDEISVSTAPDAPEAGFVSSIAAGIAPLTVTFSDQSTGTIEFYRWDFGDGATSTAPTAVHTYSDPGLYSVVLTVEGPGGSATEIKTDLIEVRPVSVAPPVAEFSQDVTVGVAPLGVAFSATGSGEIDSYAWDFGDGTVSSAAAPVHRYDEPGSYDVSLTVTGPGGSDSILYEGLVQVDQAPTIGDELVIERGEIRVDHNWQFIPLMRNFSDPVVVVNGLSSNGGQPAVVRVDGVSRDGFWVRVQEWEYLDGSHAEETTSYLVVERGRHQLPNGTWIEADEIPLDGTEGFVQVALFAPFIDSPVVLSAVVSDQDQQAVVVRQRRISPEGFELRLQHEEALSSDHGEETVAFIAWEPSVGELDGLPFEVSNTPDAVRHSSYGIDFASGFAQAPVLLAQPQTSDGGDTANLRWHDLAASGVNVYIDEEQSRDSETQHTTEVVGYIGFGSAR